MELLFNPSLRIKRLLRAPTCDEQSGQIDSILLPSVPARSGKHKMVAQGEIKKTRFPAGEELLTTVGKAKLLHFFANHELLAVEIMAYMLLKFPKAEKNYRSGLVKTIIDEQKHLTMYLDELDHLGYEFGDFSINDYFWRHLTKAKSPLDFVVHMNLTFEQANLDYCEFYRNLYAKHGCWRMVRILDLVFQDEIRHVHGGYKVFKEKTKGLDPWLAYRDRLRFPVCPMRAKGPVFSRKARRDAGIDDSFMDQLECFIGGRGGMQTLWICNPLFEYELSGQREEHLPERLRSYADQMPPLLLSLAKRTDILWLKSRPSQETLRKWKESFGILCEFVVASNVGELVTKLNSRKIGNIRSWAVTESVREAQKTLGALNCKLPEREVVKKVASKIWSQNLYKEIYNSLSLSDRYNLWSPVGQVVQSMEELRKFLEREFSKNQYADFYLKAPYGFSGRNMKPVREADLKAQTFGWAERVLRNQGAILVEPRLKPIVDFSVQLQIREHGVVELLTIQKFRCDNRGQYLGTWVGEISDGWDLEQKRFYFGSRDFHGAREVLNETAKVVGKNLFKEGYFGPAGMDAFIYLDHNLAWKLRPIVEVNTRLTMGRICWQLEKKGIVERKQWLKLL